MAVSHTNALELLGKNISFTISLNVPEQYKDVFPDLSNISGQVEAVIIDLYGRHELLVHGNFYVLSEIDIHLTA